MAKQRPAVSLINVDVVTVDELVEFIYPMVTIPNTDDIRVLAALMVQCANEYSVYSAMHAKMVAKKSISEKSSENNAKIDILYRALRCTELNYQAVSRILTAAQTKNPSYKWGGYVGDENDK